MENYYLYRLAIFLVAHVPVWLAYFVAGVIAEFNFVINVRSRRGVYANQRRVLPPNTGWFRRWRTARSAFRNFGYSIVDFFRIPLMDQGNKEHFVAELRGWEYLEQALDAGKGGIFVTVHMGSWELGGAYLGLCGLPLTAVVLRHRETRIDDIYRKGREAAGMEVVPIGGALARLESALLRRRFVAFLADRDTRGKGPLLPFFGEVTHMPDGHALLALKTGAWLLPTTIYRLRNGMPVIEIKEPIVPDPSCDSQQSLTLECFEYLEAFIRAHPEQWFSFYNLWSKTELPVA